MKLAIEVLRSRRDNTTKLFINKSDDDRYHKAMEQIRELNTAIDLLSNHSVLHNISDSNYRCPPSERCKTICEECATYNVMKT